MHTGHQIFFILCYLRRQRALRLWVICRTLQILVYICNFPFPRELVLFGRDRAREAPQDTHTHTHTHTHSTSPNPRCALLEDPAAGPFQASSRVHRLDANIFKYYTAKRQVQKFFQFARRRKRGVLFVLFLARRTWLARDGR